MPRDLVWVNKNAASEWLSRSAASEDKLIRRQAQVGRRHIVSEDGTDNDGLASPPSPANEQVCQAVQSSSVASARSLHATARHGPEPYLPDAQTVFSLCMPPSHALWTGPQLTEVERRSLDFFRYRTAHDWAGWQDAGFWSQVALQLCHDNEALAHCLISLAAMHESVEFTAPGTPRQRWLAGLSLGERDKAISIAASSSPAHLQALASCIALLCLQNLQQGHHSFRLLKAGTSILEEYERMTPSDEATITQEKHVVARLLRLLIDQLRCRLVSTGNSLKALHTSILLRRKQLPAHFQPLMPPTIPTRFISILQARNTLQSIFQWSHDTIAADPAMQSPANLRFLFRTWSDRLSAMHEPNDSPNPLNTKISKHLLSAASLHGQILIETFQTPTEMVFDAYHAEFEGIVSAIELARISIPSPHRSNMSFGTDSGLVDMISFVAQHCRYPLLRRRAIALLMQGGHIEGGRLALTAGVISQQLIDLEESSIQPLLVHDPSDIPEEHRIRIWRGAQYFRLRKIQLVFCGPPYDPAHGAVEKTAWVTLPERIQDSVPETGAAGGGSTAHYGLIADLSTPDTVIGNGFVAFLEDRKARRYYTVDSSPFSWPIPKIA